MDSLWAYSLPLAISQVKCGKSKGPQSRNTYSTYQVKDHHTVSVMQEPNLTDLFYLPLKYFIWPSQ